MKIATFNINNIKRRLPNLLGLARRGRSPTSSACRSSRRPTRSFPADALRRAGYGAVWRGQKTWNGVAILARGATPILTRGELPGDRGDTQSRYIEAAVNGVLSPRSMRRTATRSRARNSTTSSPGSSASPRMRPSFTPPACRSCWPATTTWCRPTLDIYPTKSCDDDALLQPESRAAYRRLLEQGWVDAIRTLHPDEPIYTFWDYMRQPLAARRRPAPRPPAAERRTSRLASQPPASTARCAAKTTRATMRRCGSSCAMPRAVRGARPRKSRARRPKRRRRARRRPPSAAPDAPAFAGDRRRFVRASLLSRAAEDHPADRRQGRRRDRRLCEFSAAALRDREAARRAGRLGHARRADLSAREISRLSERAASSTTR